MEPDCVTWLQEWFVGWCRGNFGDIHHAYEPCRDPLHDTWTVQAVVVAHSYDDAKITPHEIFEGVRAMVHEHPPMPEGWVIDGFDMSEHPLPARAVSFTFKWIGIEEEGIPTLKRTRQLEDDALQAHLRLLPLTSRTGVVEEAWAKANGVRARAEEDHWMWVTCHMVLLDRLDDARRYWAARELAHALREAPAWNSLKINVDLRDGPDAFGRAFAEAMQRQQD